MNKEDFGVWKLNPVTQEFFKVLSNLIDEGLEELESGVHTGNPERTYMVLGKLNAYRKILKTDFED